MIAKSNILATLAYYDIFDFPLKAEEIHARLVNFKHIENPGLRTHEPEKINPEISLDDIHRELNQLILDGVIDRAGNYYFLFDREYLVPLRLKREKIAKHKWQIARHAIRRLRFIPYLRAVFASGSLAMNNTDELSDLDVLIVVQHGRIWLTRLLITALLSMLNVRRRGIDKIAPDKICLNHYITERSLCIPYKSIYNAQTYANLAPILASKRTIENFQKANDWVLDYMNNWNIEFVEVKPQQSILAWSTEWFLEISGLGSFFNKITSRYQSRRIAQNPATGQAGGRVIFTNEQLEFHPHSMETLIIRNYNERLLKLNLPQLAAEKDSGLDSIAP